MKIRLIFLIEKIAFDFQAFIIFNDKNTQRKVSIQ